MVELAHRHRLREAAHQLTCGAFGTHKQEQWTIQVFARSRHFLNERVVDVIVVPDELSKAGV
jgi:hypothetical protein